MVVSFIDKEKERQKPVKEHRKLNMNPIKNRLNSVSSNLGFFFLHITSYQRSYKTYSENIYCFTMCSVKIFLPEMKLHNCPVEKK
jgi:hypothetical protein